MNMFIGKLKLFLVLLLSLGTLFLYAPATSTSAVDCTKDSGSLSTHDAIQCGVSGASGNSNTAPTPKQSTDNFNHLLTTILNLLSVAVGIAAVLMIVLGGLKFVTSAGNAEKAKSARSTLLYAVIGLVIVALAQIIVQFVLNKTSTDAAASGSSTGSSGLRTGGGVNERPN